MGNSEQAATRPSWLARRRAERARERTARKLYLAVVARARRTEPYARFGVPDTPDGRFEMLGLECALLLRRLRALGTQGEALGQSLLEVMVTDLDRNLREMGVGDLSVGRYVRRMTSSLLARAAALDAALASGDGEALAAHLGRALYADGPPPSSAQLRALADAVVRAAIALDGVPGERLLAGELDSGAAAKAVDPSAAEP